MRFHPPFVRSAIRLVLSLAAVTGSLTGLAAPAQADAWDFVVRLDGKPIGTHRFVVEETGDARQVVSTARFDVKLLGLTVFRYRHDANERWRANCVRELRSRTDDDGKPVRVEWRFDPAEPADEICMMSYAYWHPALVQQRRLLNPQTGEIDAVRIERLPDAALTVGGRDVDASRWRISTTPPNPSATPQVLTLWRNRADDRWIGLDAGVRGGRVLTYRLQ